MNFKLENIELNVNLFYFQLQNIYTKFEDNKYRYLTDINKFARPFMAKSISIHPKECAGGSSYGCGIRWEILGSSKRLGMIITFYFFTISELFFFGLNNITIF